MKFNGGFSCSGTADTLSCKLSCPKNVNFEFQPAEIYTCSYATGEFLPSKVPRCVYGNIFSLFSERAFELKNLSRYFFFALCKLPELYLFNQNLSHHSAKQMEQWSRKVVVKHIR